MTETPDAVVQVPGELVDTQVRYHGDRGREFVAALPGRAAAFLDRWGLRLDGPSMFGVCALVLPVVRQDGTPAVLKLQQVDDETVGEPAALRAWGGHGAVRLLEHDAATGTMLLERLTAARQLTSVDARTGVLVIAELLARLTAVPAPSGMRRLADMARDADARSPRLRQVADPEARRVLTDCAAAQREVLTDLTDPTDGAATATDTVTAAGTATAIAPGTGARGDRLLHWDLHFENVLAADREPWLAIDPKPLAGDPGFELFPALHNRFEADEVVWRFDAMTDVMGLDRDRARGWTLARVLQTCLWDVERELPPTPRHVEIARRLLAG